jgi:hypothetical protein
MAMKTTTPTSFCACIGCGCDDARACFDEAAGQPCRWLRLDPKAKAGLCSCCGELLAAWDAGDRTFRVPLGD